MEGVENQLKFNSNVQTNFVQETQLLDSSPTPRTPPLVGSASASHTLRRCLFFRHSVSMTWTVRPATSILTSLLLVHLPLVTVHPPPTLCIAARSFATQSHMIWTVAPTNSRCAAGALLLPCCTLTSVKSHADLADFTDVRMQRTCSKSLCARLSRFFEAEPASLKLH